MTIYPCVYVVGDEYRIVVASHDAFICTLEVGSKIYKDHNSGIMNASDVHSFRVKQSALDRSGKYSLTVRKFIRKFAYDTEFGDEERFDFNMQQTVKRNFPAKPFTIYYTADVHDAYDKAINAAEFAKAAENVSLVVFGGDLGEIQTPENAVDFCRFMHDMTNGGTLPALYCRGNHDTRGGYSQELWRYSGTDDKKSYFTFTYKGFCGLVLDCGEDKPDSHPVYGGGNAFHEYRIEESKFIERVLKSGKRVDAAFCHITFMQRSSMNGEFDIETRLYDEWANLLNEITPGIMISGHTHKIAFSEPTTDDIRPYNYPVLVAAEINDRIVGSLVTFTPDGNKIVRHVNDLGEITSPFTVRKPSRKA